MNQPLVVGNWKMNGSVEETLKMIAELHHKLGQVGVEVVIAPPFTALYSANVVVQETSIKLAGQNMHWEVEGAFTGEVSGLFLKETGCSYVILGHSERRQHFGETDEMIGKKIGAAVTQEIVPVFCLGETWEQRQAGKTESVLENQVKKGFRGLVMADLKNVVIAYEPVWAIGSGRTPSTDEIGSALRFIRDVIGRQYDAPTANGVRMLYGGSVTPDNAADLFHVREVNGFLVGGASLVISKFLKIIQCCDEKVSEGT